MKRGTVNARCASYRTSEIANVNNQFNTHQTKAQSINPPDFMNGDRGEMKQHKNNLKSSNNKDFDCTFLIIPNGGATNPVEFMY